MICNLLQTTGRRQDQRSGTELENALLMWQRTRPTVAATVLANLADDQEADLRDLRKCSLPNLASGSKAGSTAHLPLPKTIPERTWCLLSRLPRTRLIYAPTQDQTPIPSCSVACASSRFNPTGDVPSADFGEISPSTPCHRCPVFAVPTTWAVTEGRAPIQVV